MLAAVARNRRLLAARQTQSGDRVDIRLVLRNPTLVVRASECRLRRPRTGVAAGVARLVRVRRVHEPHRDTRFEGLVLDAPLGSSERPIAETAIHPRAVVEVFADVRQVFENNHRILELSGVLNGGVQHPRRPVSLQPELTDFHVAVERLLPDRFLSGSD